MTSKCIIGCPVVKLINGDARLCSDVLFRGEKKELWFSVEDRYAKYLCPERSDAFLIGLLPHAMRAGLDIVCEAPVGWQLKYQLETYLIPSLVKYGHSLYASKIIAPVDSAPILNANGIGAGASCGVDSFHILHNYLSPEYPSLKLTHLVVNNVGAFWAGEKGMRQYDATCEMAQRLSSELKIELIETNSNLAEFFVCDFIQIHTFANMFAVYALQKLWKVFFYGSSGLDFQQGFDLKDNDLYDAANYDLLTLDCLSTDNLRIYSEGGAVERIDKMRDIIDYEPAQRYLQVCTINVGSNCNTCFKCYRTLLILDALGALDKFRNVFDIDYYKKNRAWYLQRLYWNHIVKLGDGMLDVIYKKFASEIRIYDKLQVYYEMVSAKIGRLIFHKEK